MQDILTVTLNPALDLATSVAHIEPNVKLRCSPPETDPGGGGLNVARAITQLGGKARAFVALGGDTGTALRHLLERAGQQLVIHAAPGETRQSLAVTDLGDGGQYRFMLPGPDWSRADIDAARAAIRAAAPKQGFVVLSGSGPSGSSPDLYARICEDLRGTGAEVLLDTSGPALAHLAAGQEVPPLVLRMDQHEAETLARRPLATRADSADFARRLVERGAARIVIVARGADGSVLADADRKFFVRAAPITVRSVVGAGDSFVGGFTMALARGLSDDVALAHGAAAASAACMTEGTRLCLPEDFEALLPQSTVTEL
ncbi:MAG: 6-phosphofructokinase 2 PfkB [Rhodobacteraceae bacterium HLUCCA08]|nr:MAG: 6-phosphofructokinase 2 PfkB [Rhodobacteraceae bacterium HLUCCA08]